ncbi:MAG: putative signal transducing protein [Acidiferrobacterales bacterium]
MQKLYTAANLQEAHLIRGMLSAAGIETRIFNEHLQGGLGDIPFTEVYPEVWLDEEADMTLAQRILADYERPMAVRGSRRCSSCSEENPGSFEICWSCGKPL